MKKLSKNKLDRYVCELEGILVELEKCKKHYKRLDELAVILKGHDISKSGFVVVDNFLEKNVAFRATGVHRFEIKKVSKGK